MSFLQFFYNNNNGTNQKNWIPYPKDINEALCGCVVQRDNKGGDMLATTELLFRSLELKHGNNIVVVDLDNMVQVNQTSGVRQEICCVERNVKQVHEFEADRATKINKSGNNVPLISFDDYHSQWTKLATTKKSGKIQPNRMNVISSTLSGSSLQLSRIPTSNDLTASRTKEQNTCRMWYPQHSLQTELIPVHQGESLTHESKNIFFHTDDDELAAEEEALLNFVDDLDENLI